MSLGTSRPTPGSTREPLGPVRERHADDDAQRRRAGQRQHVPPHPDSCAAATGAGEHGATLALK
jgi:hypothetical protein